MSENIKLKEFEKNRDNLISKLESAEIDKTEFIIANYEFFTTDNMEPYEKINEFSEGLYNYQYYNTMAKYLKMKSQELKYKDPFVAVDCRKKADKYYHKKELVTRKLLDLYQDRKLDAYYIDIDSKSLRGNLFEIVFLEYDRVILHSKDRIVLKKINSMQKFDKKYKKSMIDEYINSLY